MVKNREKSEISEKMGIFKTKLKITEKNWKKLKTLKMEKLKICPRKYTN